MLRDRRLRLVAAVLLFGAGAARPVRPVMVEGQGAQGDLDAFMQQVVARRDDNWKKLQQYILDEREAIEVLGPVHMPLWGERRDYTWYLRDGFFVRSPVTVNGVTIGEDDRRQYEADYLRRVQRRDSRQPGPAPGIADAPAAAASDLDGLIRQTRQPQFISSAYLLRFKFEEGHYALVGREMLEGMSVLRVEYYPAKLFADKPKDGQKPDPYDQTMQRLMNKSSLVTLWIEPTAHQIVKYTFENLGLEFLPAQWLLRVNDTTVSMRMGQPFPNVWLPQSLEMHVGLTMAIGPIDVRYSLTYHDYRQADVHSTLIIPEP
jgi:hypothetical protein